MLRFFICIWPAQALDRDSGSSTKIFANLFSGKILRNRRGFL